MKNADRPKQRLMKNHDAYDPMEPQAFWNSPF